MPDLPRPEHSLLQLQELPDGLPELQVPNLSPHELGLPQLQDLATDLQHVHAHRTAKHDYLHLVQTLFTYPDTFRAQLALTAAKYIRDKLTVAKDFVNGESYKPKEFLKKFPLGKVSDFEGPGVGSDGAGQAQIVNGNGMADNEIPTTSYTRMYPTRGIMQYNKYTTDRAHLADIAVAGTLHNRFTIVDNQRNSGTVIGSITHYTEMSEDHTQASTVHNIAYTGADLTRMEEPQSIPEDGIHHHHQGEPGAQHHQHVSNHYRDGREDLHHQQRPVLSTHERDQSLQPDDLLHQHERGLYRVGREGLHHQHDGLLQQHVTDHYRVGREGPMQPSLRHRQLLQTGRQRR